MAFEEPPHKTIPSGGVTRIHQVSSMYSIVYTGYWYNGTVFVNVHNDQIQ